MVTEPMGDSTHANVSILKRYCGDLHYIAGYVTGTPDIKWTDTDWAQFPDATHITIDQGGPGSPVDTAIVRDVEPGAWNAKAAVNKTGWNVERPTIYCDRSDLSSVLANGWRGDIWLAYPGWNSPEPPSVSAGKIVAVQNNYYGTYDTSTVYDTTWPFAAIHNPPPNSEDDMISEQVYYGVPVSAGFPAGSLKTVTVYRDFLSDTNVAHVRVALHSKAHGYEVRDMSLNQAVPYILPDVPADIDAISVEVTSGPSPVGVTLTP